MVLGWSAHGGGLAAYRCAMARDPEWPDQHAVMLEWIARSLGTPYQHGYQMRVHKGEGDARGPYLTLSSGNWEWTITLEHTRGCGDDI